MKTPRRGWLVSAALLLVLAALVLWFARQSARPTLVMQRSDSAGQAPSPNPTSTATTPPVFGAPANNEPGSEQQRAFIAAFAKPIVFFGKVLDQKGHPVSGASVEWSANNNPNPSGSGTQGRSATDAEGLFSITSFGIGLYAKVWKDGYAQIQTELRGERGSSGGFSNLAKLGNTDSPMGTRSDPAIFVLRKKGEADELVHVTERPVMVPRNGIPVEIALDSGQVVPAGRGDLRIECWSEVEKKDARGKYPWRCRLSIPGGGLANRGAEFDFVAPVDTYQQYDDITPSDEHWTGKAERQYFVKLANGHYARVNVRMRMGDEPFAVIESFFNPKLGSRNLEYDRTKVILPR